MRRRWVVDEGVVFVLGAVSMFAWIPTALIGQVLTSPGGLDDNAPIGWGFWAGPGVWFGPWLLAGLLVGACAVWRSLPFWRWPIRRVSEPVMTDLRATMGESERRL